jgi:hypothetical protein
MVPRPVTYCQMSQWLLLSGGLEGWNLPLPCAFFLETFPCAPVDAVFADQ